MVFPKKSPLPFFAAPCEEMSIDALQLITEQIGADVKILVHALGQREGKCTDTLKSLYAAFGQGLAIVGGLMNAAAPINRIPSELLTTIFALSLRTQLPGFGQIQIPFWPFKPLWVDDLHRLPKVCRYWRELALATPTLWSTIVTVPPPDHWKCGGGDHCFGRSVYLSDDCSPDLTVHFDPSEPSQDSAKKMIKFMLTNSRRTRQLHAWDIASSIGDPLSFLQSFDAHALEHCTFWWKTGLRVEPPRELSSKPGHLLFFSNGGARLRSLCLVDVLVLPENKFPLLTLLEIGFIRRRAANMLWEMEDLFDFLAGCPNLEELYLHDIPETDPDRRASSRRQPGSPITVSLPRLQYLAFTYRYPNDKKPKYNVDDSADPIDFILSRISIPPSCHMYLGSPAMETDADRVLASVCRHVPGKDAVSHMFLRPSNDVSSPIQLVFRHGSLRLHIPKDSSWVLQPATASHFAYHDFFRTFPHLFATTAEVRIHYDDDYVMTPRDAPFPVPAAVFPQVTALSVIRDTNRARSREESHATLRAGLAHLVQPPCKPLPRRSRLGPGNVNATAQPGLRGRSPYPLLDTLWTSVESTDEVAELETALAARSAAGLPIRRLVVTLRHYPVGDSAARDGDIARLRALGAGVEEVVVMDGEVSSELREMDWLAGLPERYDLPSSIHRDWPAVWGR